MPDPAAPGKQTYVSLFLVCMAGIMYEIVLTRIYSVIMWHHFAFMAVSVAMFGMTVGSLVIYYKPQWRGAEVLRWSAWLCSVSVSVSLILELYLPKLTTDMVPLVTFSYLNTSVPFFFSGIFVSYVLSLNPDFVGKLYATDLAGAATGCLILPLLLNASDGPTAILVISTVVALASWLISPRSHPRWARITAATTILLLVFALTNGLLFRLNRPLLRIAWAKGVRQEKPLYERWNTFSRIQVKKDFDLSNANTWGLSPLYLKNETPVEELFLDIDASASTILTQFDGDIRPLLYLKYDLTNFAYYLRSNASVCVIGMGGGRDALSALTFGQKRVVGIEINDQIVNAVHGRFGDFTGHLDRHPNVTVVNDEARTYLSRSRDQFDIIQISLIDTWAATAAGAFALSENSLYTLEAWQLFIRRLSTDGLLTVSRWNYPKNNTQLYRLTTLAAAALRSSVGTNPAQHLAILATTPTVLNPGDDPKGIATLILSKRPFTQKEIRTMERRAAGLHFDVLAMPGVDGDETIKKLIAGAKLRKLHMDLEPPTDDRPFFFNVALPSAFLSPWKRRSLNLSDAAAPAILAILLLLIGCLTAVTLFIPLAMSGRKIGIRKTFPYVIYFASLGMAFLFIEISQVQRLAIYLGSPTLSLTVVLFSLLMACAVGSAVVNKTKWTTNWLVILLVVLCVFGKITPGLLRYFDGAQAAFRYLLAVALLVPIGFVMGMPFALGFRIARQIHYDRLPWFWGINGATSVFASVLTVVMSLLYGISASYWTGVGFYAIACVAFLIGMNRDAQKDVEAGGIATGS